MNLNQLKQENRERSTGNLTVTNFHCSQHGYIKPQPRCPKCEADTINTLLDAIEEEMPVFVEKGTMEITMGDGRKTTMQLDSDRALIGNSLRTKVLEILNKYRV